VLLLALAPELDLRYERLYGFLQDDVSRRRPSVDLALKLLCATPVLRLAHRERFTLDAPLLGQGLLTLVPDPTQPSPPWLAHALKLEDRVVGRLLGHGGLDPVLRTCCSLPPPIGTLDDLALPDGEGRALAALVASAWSAGEPLQLCFSGPRTRAKQRVARALAGMAGAPLVAVDLGYALASGVEFGELVRRLLDEARLRGAIVYAEPLEALLGPDRAVERQRLLDGLATYGGVTILAGVRASAPGGGRDGQLQVPFDIPGHLRRKLHWRSGLEAAGASLGDAELEQLAGRFRLTADQITDAVTSARNRARWRAADSSGAAAPGPARLGPDDLFEAARAQSDAALDGLAGKIEPAHRWDQIVLPDDTVGQLRELCQQVAQGHRVLGEWGFGRQLSLGKGVTALFAGPSGTGKTMAAEIIANELRLDLYKIDLSGVVSKYIGETEKNLERIFAAAENANAILLFDEADALFGKRSEVRDAHDRYANVEIAYLLQQMDQYQGIAILATNLRQNMDEAFIRRLRFVVEFPFPDEHQRARIWRVLFPPEAARDPGIDFSLLGARYRVAGGSIQNIVLGAAFLAAAAGEPIAMAHLHRAARREYQKLGKLPPPDAEPLEALAGAVAAKAARP
jgi:AAA+ superfamily predicted ATPase